MTSVEYWRERAKLTEERSYRRGTKLVRRLFELYESAAKEIRSDVTDFYIRYAVEQKISLSDARKKLNSREAREWKKTVEEYLEEIEAEEDKEIKKRLKADYAARSYASRITRLDALEGKINMELSKLAASCEGEMKATAVSSLKREFNLSAPAIAAGAGSPAQLVGLDPKTIEGIVSYPWSGATFSERLWKNRDSLAFQLQEILTKGIIKGDSGATMAARLAEAEGQSFKAAERLVRTETARIHTAADMRAYADAGIEQYEFMASLDERTCEVCGKLDGKIFAVSDAVVGENYPPVHPNCRCTTVAVFPERQGGKKSKTYEEWSKEFEPKEK